MKRDEHKSQDSPETKIWTIGHSTRTLDEFLELLAINDVRLLADVRRFPGSRKYPHFNQDPLKESLAEAGFAYAAFPELGGRRKPLPNTHNTVWRNPSFRAYADHMETEEFAEGISRLLGEMRSMNTAIMCSEAVWWRCHRALISDHLRSRGIKVLHILSPGKTEPHPYTSAARIVGGKLTYSPDS